MFGGGGGYCACVRAEQTLKDFSFELALYGVILLAFVQTLKEFRLELTLQGTLMLAFVQFKH